MAGQRRVNRDRRRFEVANFPQHHHVRRLAEHRAQRQREGEANGLLHLHLVDAGQQVFDRVLDGDNFSIGTVNVV